MYRDGLETITIRMDIPEDEKNELREEYIQHVVEINSIDSQIKELRKSIKAIAEQNTAILDRVLTGYDEVEMDLEYENDFEDRVRRYFDKQGVEVHTRKLKASENQESFLKVING